MFTIRMLAATGLSAVLVTGSYARDTGDTLTHEKSKASAARIDRSFFVLPETGDSPLSGPAPRSLVNSAEYWNLKRLDDNKKNFQHDQKVEGNKPPEKAKNFIGGTDDGQSMIRKQEQSQQGAESSRSKLPDQKFNPNKDAAGTKNFIGGTDDGNSIRRKQPHRGGDHSATLPNEKASMDKDAAEKKNFIGSSDDGASMIRKQSESKGRSGSGLKLGRRGK